ncbi:MAG: hypothetical protein HY689_14500 [Chloroflexi bacterium]|nr:hypothetical protein [Chloroflexota bacterium]
MQMLHLPKLASWHGVLVPSRQIPLWLPWGALTATLLIALVAAGLSFLGESTVQRQDGVSTRVVARVISHINEWNPQADPLITLPGGVQAKASNVYGIDINGMRYFYQLTRGSSFDPLRVGTAEDYEVVAVVDAGTPWEVLIYRLR